MSQQTLDLIRWTVSLVVPVLAGFAGVLIGAWLTARRETATQRLAFIEKQLSHLYSPLIGIHNEILMLQELRSKISKSADKQWKKLCEDAGKLGEAHLINKRLDEDRDVYEAILHYDNLQLTESLLPSYRRMVELLRDNYCLAEFETREYFQHLLEYIELWDRWLAKSIPSTVLKDIGHGEGILLKFYEHLQEQHDALRAKLEAGKP